MAYRLAHGSAVGQIGRAVETVRSYQQRSVMLLSATLVLVGLASDIPEIRDGLNSGACWSYVGAGIAVIGILGAFICTALINSPLKGNFEPSASVIVESYGDDLEQFADLERFTADDWVYRELATFAGKAAEDAEIQCARRAKWMSLCVVAPFVSMIGLAILIANG